MNFPFIHQQENNDCGPTCLQMMARFYGKDYKLDFLKKKCQIKKNGVSMLNIFKTAKEIGFHCKGVKMKIEKLKQIVQNGPVIIYYNENHFAIVYRTPKPGKTGGFYLADPARGSVTMSEAKFSAYWISKKIKGVGSGVSSKRISASTFGYALLLEPV